MGPKGSRGSGRVIEENGESARSVARDRLPVKHINVRVAGAPGLPAELRRRSQRDEWVERWRHLRNSPCGHDVTCRVSGSMHPDAVFIVA